MSNSNFESFDGEWEEYRGDYFLTEFQWRNYLNKVDREIARFLAIYETIKHNPNHLDEVIAQMGWETDDLLLSEDDLDDAENDADTPDDGEPYTVHRHPVFVISRGLNRFLQESWERAMVADALHPTALESWHYGKALGQANLQAILAVQSLDMGDLGLVICHMKHALDNVNKALGILDTVVRREDARTLPFREEMRHRLFDLREMWLRVINDCRLESQRRSRDGDERG